MSKPIIGVMPLWDDEKESLWMLPGYFDGIRHAGGIPIMLPLTDDEQDLEQLVEACEGFLFTGGHDVTPELYSETVLEGLVYSCRKRDDMEKQVLKLAIRKEKPVLGICRGIQFINVALGGTLYQDIPTQCPSPTDHHQTPPYDVPVHVVKIMDGSPLHKCLNKEQLSVNSYHHQAVKAVAPGLKIMAVAEDELVEGLYMPAHPFLWAVQWHPEFSWQKDENSRKIFRAFVDATRSDRVENPEL